MVRQTVGVVGRGPKAYRRASEVSIRITLQSALKFERKRKGNENSGGDDPLTGSPLSPFRTSVECAHERLHQKGAAAAAVGGQSRGAPGRR